MFIAYQNQGGIEYARLAESYRENGKIKKRLGDNLGRVLDKKRGIYQSRARGVFTFDLASNTYGSPPPDFGVAVRRKNGKEKLLVDFGDAFLVDALFEKFGLHVAINAIGYGNQDSVRALLMYYILEKRSNNHALTWFEGSYARFLYPKANLSSQSISRMLAAIGEEGTMRAFFKEYLKLLGEHVRDAANILIDSTGLPNSIRFPLTAVSNHNGEISEEVRLIYVVQQGSRLPIYMRYVPGNVVDNSTLITTMKELKAIGVNTKFAILDAGYVTEEVIEHLLDGHISFITRCPTNRTIYKKALAAALPTLEVAENLAVDEAGRLFNNQQVYVKCVSLPWGEPDSQGNARQIYAYVGKDKAMQEQERKHAVSRITHNGSRLDKQRRHDLVQEGGVFVLLSSRKIRAELILSHYYIRQEIEQVFDISKNYASLLPLNVESEAAFRGHLLMTFISTVLLQMLQSEIRNSDFSLDRILMSMRTLKAKVFTSSVIPWEPVKEHNEIYKLLGIKQRKEYILKTAAN